MRRRAEFEADALPHLETLWRQAVRLTRSHTQADDLVVRTMAVAYRAWFATEDTVPGRVRLFRMLLGEYARAGSAGDQGDAADECGATRETCNAGGK